MFVAYLGGWGIFHKTFLKNIVLGNIPISWEMNENEEPKRQYSVKGKEKLNQ